LAHYLACLIDSLALVPIASNLPLVVNGLTHEAEARIAALGAQIARRHIGKQQRYEAEAEAKSSIHDPRDLAKRQ
jgi:hypothetical protein